MTAEATAEMQVGVDIGVPPRPKPEAGPEMFTYAAWVHLGFGAETCDQRETGECTDEQHFHAWIRLPNKLQHKDIAETAEAASARRLRELKREDSDAAQRIELELSQLREAGNDELIVDDLMTDRWGESYLQASEDINEQDEFEHIGKDQERYQELFKEHDGATVPKEDWPSELRELDDHIRSYLAAVEKRQGEIQEPERQALLDLGRDGLIDRMRERRYAIEADLQRLHVYKVQQWLTCTYTHRPPRGRKRKVVWEDADALREEAPEVLDAVQVAFEGLELALQRASQGNS